MVTSVGPTPMGENFSGSCIVTSRNSLIHIGATTATKSGRFRRWRTAPESIVKGLKPRRGVACYRELRRILLPHTQVNRGKKMTGYGRMLTKALKEVPSVEPAGAGKTAVVR
jgi:hypothetical protein